MVDRLRRVFDGRRPPPLKTASTYDDDDNFARTANHLLEKYHAGISPKDAIQIVLASPKQRTSFFEGINLRKDKEHLKLASVVDIMEKLFYGELKLICGNESQMSAKKHTTRKFFQDGELFRKRKIQNIDWKLTESIQQVENLRLDGSTPKHVAYEPPIQF